MTFGGLIAAYVVIQANKVAEWRPFDLPIQVWISTALIIASSITYEIAKRAIDRNQHGAAKRWLIVTTVLGAAFISSQVLAWIELTRRGLYMSGNPYAGFFYVLTAIHAVHVVGGIGALGSILLRSWLPAVTEEGIAQRRSLAQVVGWYWHFMGGLWLVLFVLLGFWK
jgi:cytochrome c oxidase subunit 3